MAFNTTDIKRGILELSTCDKKTYCMKYAQLFRKVVTRASEAVIASMGVELLQMRPRELGYSQRTKLWSKWDADVTLFYDSLKSKAFAKVDFSECGGTDISGLDLSLNKTVTRELVESSPDLSGVVLPELDLTGCNLKDKPISGADLSRVTGLKPENLFPDYSDKTWSPNYIAKSYNGVKFPELDMTGVPIKYLLFKNCKGLKNGRAQSTVELDFGEYIAAHKSYDTFNFTSRSFSSPFTVPCDKKYYFIACDLTNATFTKGEQVRRLEKCRISLKTYRTFFKGNKGMRKFMTDAKISCPELDTMVSELADALRVDKNRVWRGEREEGWDILKIHSDFQKEPSTIGDLIATITKAA